jgi:type IV pilus assembly protein PilN
MRNLEGSGWMKSPELTIIEAKAQESAQGSAVVDVKALPYMFELKVNLPNPSSEEIDAQRLEEAGMVEETAAAAAQTVNDASDAAAEPAAVAPAPDKAAPAADAAQPAAAPATTGADS